MTLQSAGPGLVVMVIALLCSLVGALRSKIEMRPDAVNIAAAPDSRDQESIQVIPVCDAFDGVELPGMVKG